MVTACQPSLEEETWDDKLAEIAAARDASCPVARYILHEDFAVVVLVGVDAAAAAAAAVAAAAVAATLADSC
jgi:hypothetical protein